MFSGIIYLALFIAVFFLPGFFITVMLGIKKFRFLLSLALSYSLLVLTLLPFEYYARPVVCWEKCILAVWLGLAVLVAVKIFIYENSNIFRRAAAGRRAVLSEIRRPLTSRGPTFKHRKFKTGRDGSPSRPILESRMPRRGIPTLIYYFLTPRLIVPLVLVAVVCGYLAYAGPYLEIPSDAWTHVYRFQWQRLSVIETGRFPAGLAVNSLLLHHTFNYWHFNPWYFIQAWLSHVSGLPVMDALPALSFATVTVFLLGFYYFGLFLFAGLRVSALKKMIMAALAALFAVATMGNLVFAYIRYYAFAPAILNYVLFLAAMALIVVWLRSGRCFGPVFWITPVLLLVTSLIHIQETLFIIFMTLALGLAGTIRIIWRKIRYSQTYRLWRYAEIMKILPAPASGHPSNGGELTLIPSREGQGWVGNHWAAREWKSVILGIILLIVFFTGFIMVRYFKPGAWISPAMIMPSAGIPAEPVNFIFRKLLLSPPENILFRLIAYQLFVFYQVIGLWGLFVYLLFFLMLRRFVKMPYLMAGMVIAPFLTVFNPLTIDMMARLGQDPTLYRFLYMIPLPFIAGYLFVFFLGKARAFLRPRRIGLGFLGCILVLAGLLGLVFPINAAGIYAPYSKIYTLRRIPAANAGRLWLDLGKFMEKYENKIILTDYLTRFMAPYFPKNNCICSTWLNSPNPEKDRPAPYTWEALRGCGLIIINRRDGALSVTGRIARHWPEDVLRVSRYYSPAAQAWLESHPEKFQKVWSQNQIAVYAVR